MKIKILSLVLISSIIMSFTKTQNRKFRPPGTVEIVDNFFFDETERMNIDWKEYLSYLKVEHGMDSEIYQKALPDTTVWRDKDGGDYNEPFVQTYFQHPSYDQYPVVGVSHQQAKDYCKWRTKAVKRMLKANDIQGPKSFEYRLPSQTEWELIAAGGYSEKAKRAFRKYEKKAKKSQKKYEPKKQNEWMYIHRIVNMRYNDTEIKINENFPGVGKVHMTAPARTYWPNKFGVFNIYGNVAEMVNDQGVAMGGSWQDYYNDIVLSNKILKYEGPAKWLGFRCVCEITEE